MASKSFFQLGEDAYSYETCIRTSGVNNLGSTVTIGNITKYSKTTSRHQKEANVQGCEFQFDNLPRGTTADDLRKKLQAEWDRMDAETEGCA